MKPNPISSGFSLIEIMVIGALLAFISITTFSMFIWAIRTNQRVDGSRETLSASRRLIDALSEEISAASAIYSPTTNETQLSLITAHNPPDGESESFVDFFQCGTNLCLKREGTSTQPLLPDTVNLSRLRFIPVSASGTPAVVAGFDLEYGGAGVNLPETAFKATTTFTLRAY